MAPVVIDAALVRRLLASQFPAWAGLPVRPVDADGWDHRSFRVGETLVARLPSAEGYVPQTAKEVAWLPTIAAAVPLPVPEVVAVGEPGEGYPWPWTLRRWIEGEPATDAAPAGLPLVRALAAFLGALAALPPDGPPPGPHSAGRGAPLDQFDDEVRAALEALGDRVDAAAARSIWEAARTSRAKGAPVWFHGDVAPGNLLLRQGRLAAVIDLGLAGVGDPACDLAIAWTWFDAAERAAFRAATGADGALWARGAGWALWKALITLEEPARAAGAIRTLRALGVAVREAPGQTIR